MKLMISAKPISTIHHGNQVYKPNRKGLFEIDDAHVKDLRAHGLRLDGEPEDPVAALAASGEENAALKARVASLEAITAKTDDNAKLRARVAELEARIAAANGAKKEGKGAG